jgi:adenine-specific DNA-methyltransferase
MTPAGTKPYDAVYVTRYMGSKLRLLDFVVPRIRSLAGTGAVVVDLMAGTHAVSYALRRTHRVVTNDVQAYAVTFGRALIENTTVPHVRDRIERDMAGVDAGPARRGWFTETYADTFFSEAQCSEIEAIRAAIERVDDRWARDVYVVALAYAMSHCQSSPGHFAQFMPGAHPRVASLRARSVTRSFLDKARSIDIAVDGRAGQVHHRDVHDLLDDPDLAAAAPPGSVAYLDPPYSTAQYSRYYHLLETVVRDDRPAVAHKARYRADRHRSPFCSRVEARSAFEDVVGRAAARGWNLVVSYATTGLVAAEALEALCARRYRTVEVHRRDHPQSMQGRGQRDDSAELLFVCAGPSP